MKVSDKEEGVDSRWRRNIEIIPSWPGHVFVPTQGRENVQEINYD